MQRFKGVASGKQSFHEHCATKWLLEANPQNISAPKISRYTVYRQLVLVYLYLLHILLTLIWVYCIILHMLGNI